MLSTIRVVIESLALAAESRTRAALLCNFVKIALYVIPDGLVVNWAIYFA